MSRPIQALAPAFLQLLGLKNMGALPPDMIDTVQPVIDLESWYLRGRMQGAQSGAVAIGLASTGATLFTVPGGEWWYVHSLWGQVQQPGTATAAAINGLRMSASTPTPGVLTFGDVLQDIPDIAALGARFNVTPKSLNGVWVPPGGTLGLFADWIQITNGGGASVASGIGAVSYTPLPV